MLQIKALVLRLRFFSRQSKQEIFLFMRYLLNAASLLVWGNIHSLYFTSFNPLSLVLPICKLFSGYYKITKQLLKSNGFFLIFTPRNGKFADLLRHRENRLAKKLSWLNSNLGLPWLNSRWSSCADGCYH